MKVSSWISCSNVTHVQERLAIGALVPYHHHNQSKHEDNAENDD